MSNTDRRKNARRWGIYRLALALLTVGYIVTSKPGQVTGGKGKDSSTGGSSPGSSPKSSPKSSSSSKSSGGSHSSTFEAQAAADRNKADRIIMASGRKDVNYPKVGQRIQEYETAQQALANKQPSTLNDLVSEEQARLAGKYPGYVATEQSAKNIAQNIQDTGLPTSPMNRTPIQPETYPGYTGPRPGPGDPIGIKAALAADATYVERNKAKVVNYPAAWGGGQYSVKQQEAVNKGLTDYMKTKYGGAMAGQLRPESAMRVGFERLFAKVAARRIVEETGKALEKHVFNVSGKISREDLGKVPEGVEIKVPAGYEMITGSFKFNTELSQYEWLIREVSKPVSSADVRAKQAQEWKEGGVYERQEIGDAVKPEKKIPSGEMLKASLLKLDVPAGYELESLDLGPLEFGLGGVEQKLNYTVREKQPDMKDVDKAIKHVNEKFLPKLGSKIPLLNKIINPVTDYYLSEYRNVEYNRRLELLKATTTAQKAGINAKYNQQSKDLMNPVKWDISLEKEAGPRWSKNVLPSMSLTSSPEGELMERFKRGDIPLIDVKPSPAANAVMTGVIIGLSAGGGIVAGTTFRAKAVYGTVGVAKLGVAAEVQDIVYRTTGKNVGLSFLAGGVAYAAADAAATLGKAKLLPYNRDVQVVSNTAKATGEFKVGAQNVGTTLAKDVYVGEGRQLTLVRGIFNKAGVKVGGELPVWVRAENLLGEVKITPTFGAKTVFTTRELGLGRGLSGRTYVRKPLPAETAFKGIPSDVRVLVDYKSGMVDFGKGLEVPAGAGYKLLGKKIGVRQPIVQQDAISTVWAGAGKKQKGFVSSYSVQTGTKPTVSVSLVEKLKFNVERSQPKIRRIDMEHAVGYFDRTTPNTIYLQDVYIKNKPKLPSPKDVKIFSKAVQAGEKYYGRNIGGTYASFKSIGVGRTSEFGVRPGEFKNMRMDVGKTTRLVDEGKMAYGTERLNVDVGGMKVSKRVPLYTEVFKKLRDVGDIGLKIIKSGGGKSKGGVIDMGGGKPKGGVVEIPSMTQSQMSVLESRSHLASELSSVSRAEVAVQHMNQPSYKMAALFAPPTQTSDAAIDKKIEKVFSAAGMESLVEGRRGSAVNSGRLITQSPFADVVSGEELMSVPRQMEGLISAPRQISSLEKGGQLPKQLSEQLSMPKQIEDFLQLPKQLSEQLSMPKQMEDVLQLQRQMPKNYGGGGGGSGWTGGGFTGLPGGFADKMQGFVSGFKFTVRNPWKNLEEFAEGVLGGKKRRGKK